MLFAWCSTKSRFGGLATRSLWVSRRRLLSTGRYSETQLLTRIREFLDTPAPSVARQAEALSLCAKLEGLYATSGDAAATEMSQVSLEQAQKQLKAVLSHSNDLGTSPVVLHRFFTTRPPPSTQSSIIALQTFNKRTSKIIPESLAMIPFRNAVYSADFAGAWAVLRETRGSASHWDAWADRRLRKIALMWLGIIAGVLVAVDALLQTGYAGTWDTRTSRMILMMVATYLTALSVYGTLAFAGSRAGIGHVLEWQRGTSMLYRFRNAPQLKMATLATELNRSLPENLGECSPQMLQDLQKLRMVPTETKTEQRIKEYWARAGEGYDWIEPDQDPAEIRWWQDMERSRQRRIGSPYVRTDSAGNQLSWEQDVERWQQNMGLPHASLIDVDKLRGPEAMQKLEDDLRRINNDVKALDEGQINPELPRSNKDTDRPEKP